jgi:general secretion pathway protein A
MYEKHFGFSDLPFTVTPDPRFFYTNSVYREAFANLRYGIEGRKGFILITGEVGTGKTTLLKLFMHSAESTIHTAFIFNPKLGFSELLRAILNDLGIAQDMTDDRLSLFEKLNSYLIEQIKKRQIVALLVDEAQNLSDEMLEELRLLSNLETDKDKLLQIVLIGQPELEEKLDQPALRQLRQRVALRCRLAPLKGDEVHQYIEFRLKTVGYEGKELFDAGAVERISFYSKGTPRLINMICDNSLLIAYASSKHKVYAEMVEEVARDLQLAPPAVKIEPAPEFPAPESQDEAKIIQEMMPSMWVSRNRPANAEDYFIDTERPPPEFSQETTGAGLGTGVFLGFILAAAMGALLYSQRNSLSEVVGRIEAWQKLKQTGLIREEIKHASSDYESPPPSPAEEPSSKGMAKIETKQESEATRENSKEPLPATNIPASRSKDLPAAEPKVNQNKPQRFGSQLASLKTEAEQLGREKALNQESRPLLGNFEVVENSFLRAKPDSDAEIVATLEPGTWVRVESKSGNYLRVRSLNDGSLRGYVHQEDAFFQRIASRPRGR